MNKKIEHNKPVAAKDNFVMNSGEEIEQAITDYLNGVFGAPKVLNIIKPFKYCL